MDLVERRKRHRKHRNYKTGEDIDMLNERKSSKNEEIPICDRHIDGA